MDIFSFFRNSSQILGMNKRNVYYIRKHNKDKAKEIADDKILTKQILEKHEIPTPKLLGVISNLEELVSFNWDNLPKSFVIKPVSGLEGGGIEIYFNRDDQGQWIKADKSKASMEDLRRLAFDIISGRFSLQQEPDRIMIEERVKNHKIFKYFSYKGVPDIRVIVYNNIPVMAMLRLPTRASEGKANLALGAIGAGIDIATGTTTHAIIGKGTPIEYIPGTKLRVNGLKLPYWDKMLKYAIEAQIATNLGFAAVDFLIDRDNGPVIVELNARPGLSIQLANNDGLRWRCRKAGGLKVSSVERGIRLGKDLFGGVIEASIESLTGKDVVGIYENITLFSKDDTEKFPTKAKIDTGADSTSIDKSLVGKMGFKDIVELSGKLKEHKFDSVAAAKAKAIELLPKYQQEYPDLYDIRYVSSSHGISIRPYIKVDLKVQDTRFETIASVYDRSKLTYPVIVGRKSLARFLVDPIKR
jgi:alpha-L-glutamate ligase-like protein